MASRILRMVSLLAVLAAGAAQPLAPLSAPAYAQAAPAGESPASGGGENQCALNDVLAKFESQGSGGYRADNKRGYLGKYQMGKAALIDLKYKDDKGNWTGRNGVNSNEDWFNNTAAQDSAQQEWIDLLKKRTTGLGLDSYIGQTFPGCDKQITKEGIVAAAHLVGQGGAASFLKGGGRCDGDSTDGNGTCAGKYMCAASGCGEWTMDTSKDTCSVTMPMIEAISCSNYTGELRSFCEYARPALMTRQECASAESFAQSAPKGPNFEKCQHLTFAAGTGSWSFALACSYASDAVADGDGVANPQGPVSDPACMERLRGMGVQFDQIGRRSNGSASGKACVIENSVSYSGGAIPFPSKLEMTCEMAVAMEEFGQKMQGLGVTGYYGMSSTVACRPMRDKNGDKPGTISEHGLGRAVDISGFKVGDRKISFGAIHKPTTADGTLALAAKQLACSTFRGVLSPTYSEYTGAFVHFHVEWGALNGVCR